ncbi:MAG TPA: ECF transporter S component [Candidatus Corynebacterium avicola]|uniref:ECF transporter S component n=1 Tax=Candidatus Corynebacterium avicola TaxID=2838527 RepID=A0A9D1RLS7_9CORY|nr:ECF transporter S component [Candidatus Corynebacterium avicola]
MGTTTSRTPETGASQTNNSTTGAPTYRWRVVDIITAAVLGVACGVIFWFWSVFGSVGLNFFDSLTPGLGGLFTGVWVIGGLLGGLIIRKPGAAIFVELLGAVVEAIMGTHFGPEVIYSGLAQGLGAELVFAAFRYRKFGVWVAVLAGICANVGEWLLELVTMANYAKSLTYNLTLLGCMVISGAVLAGLVSYWLVRGLASAGALDRFAAGRERADLV